MERFLGVIPKGQTLMQTPQMGTSMEGMAVNSSVSSSRHRSKWRASFLRLQRDRVDIPSIAPAVSRTAIPDVERPAMILLPSSRHGVLQRTTREDAKRHLHAMRHPRGMRGRI